MNRGVLALLLIFSIACQNNYQQRAIFYSRSNNICCGDGANHRDNVNVIINLDDTDRIRKTYQAIGYCSNWYIFCADAVGIYESASIIEVWADKITTYITFDQQPIYTKIFGITEHINYKMTIRNPVKIMEVEYTCTILGDGTVHHWGIDYKEYPPAEVYMRCLSAKKSYITQKNLEEQRNNGRMDQ